VRYLARRLLHGVFLLIGVSLLSFLFSELAPGDYLSEMRLNPQISPQTLAGLRSQYGLDQPLPVRYVHWLKSVGQGELGFSFAYNQPVSSLLSTRARNTLMLAVFATFVAWLLAIPLGVWSASKPGRIADRTLTAGVTLLVAIPDVLLALLFLFVAVKTKLFPVGGMLSVNFAELSSWEQFKDFASHLVLPATVLVLGSLPTLVRHVRAAMIEALQSSSVQAARAHGIPRQRLLFFHALPFALNPLIGLFGLSVAALLSGSLLIEVVMSWPGLGPLLVEAILSRDLYVVIGAVVFSTVFLVMGVLISDILLFASDPRIRQEAE
jgi:peptide/nickel transport system permease protein